MKRGRELRNHTDAAHRRLREFNRFAARVPDE